MSPGKTILIWGGGGHGKVVADLVRACGHDLAGFVDRDEAKLGRKVEPGGAKVVLLEEEFLRRVGDTEGVPFSANAVALALGENSVRQAGLRSLGDCCVPALIHHSATISPSAMVGRGSVVLPGAVINAASQIGKGAIINSAAVVEHDCIISDAAHVSPRAVLAGGVHVGERSWIGAGATVIEGIDVGADVTVGAGAVVIADVPSGEMVVGVPARPIRRS